MRYIPPELAMKLDDYEANIEELTEESVASSSKQPTLSKKRDSAEDDVILDDIQIEEIFNDSSKRDHQRTTAPSSDQPAANTQQRPIPEDLGWDPFVEEQREATGSTNVSPAPSETQSDTAVTRPTRNRRRPDRYGEYVYY